MKKRRKISANKFLSDNREGQFFLIAAVIIIVVVISVVTLSNYSEKKEVVQLYDLGQELGIESQNVLEYGTYSVLNESEMKTLMEDFINHYVSYKGEGKNIYFVFGNKDRINAVGYQKLEEETVCIRLDEGECAPLTIGQGLETTKEFSKETEEQIDKVAIELGANRYEFKLRRGQNFYFVIWKPL